MEVRGKEREGEGRRGGKPSMVRESPKTESVGEGREIREKERQRKKEKKWITGKEKNL